MGSIPPGIEDRDPGQYLEKQRRPRAQLVSTGTSCCERDYPGLAVRDQGPAAAERGTVGALTAARRAVPRHPAGGGAQQSRAPLACHPAGSSAAVAVRQPVSTTM